jgi:spore germination protein KB
MESAKISPYQLFSLIVLFELGTALVVPLGMEAKQDAWLAILLGLIGGLLLFLVYYYLFINFPNEPLTGYLQQILGKYIGWPIGLLYVLFFIYGSARDLRDASELLTASGYNQTPALVISAIMIAIITYGIYLGIEVLARASGIFLIVMLMSGIAGNLLILMSGLIKIDQLLPVLEHGWKPVLAMAYPRMLMFPFGEMICFTMIFPILNKANYLLRTGMSALVLSGILLMLTSIVEITTLGVANAASAVFPLLKTVDKVNIGQFLERLDALAVLALIVGDFFKIAVFFYAAHASFVDLFKLKKGRKFVLPAGITILLTSKYIAGSMTEHLEQGQFALRYIFTFFSALIPSLLLIIHCIRRVMSKVKASRS